MANIRNPRDPVYRRWPIEKQRRIFAMRDQGLMPLEIARKLGVNLHSVCALIRDGMPAIRSLDGGPVVSNRQQPTKRCPECGRKITTEFCVECEMDRQIRKEKRRMVRGEV